MGETLNARILVDMMYATPSASIESADYCAVVGLSAMGAELRAYPEPVDRVAGTTESVLKQYLVLGLGGNLAEHERRAMRRLIGRTNWAGGGLM